ncbi:MAG: hypothetical protein J7L47_10745 [Candidatus Odinarchaeota archaeon]|nr:hypothetical protein [Candidatus Odinarchaeota archaeon]
MAHPDINITPSSNNDDNVIYVAPVIHMNQLILDLTKAHIYGGVHPADVFRHEIEIILKHPGAKLVVDITGPTLYDLTWTAPDIIDKIKQGIEKGQIEILGISYGQVAIQYMNLTDVQKHYEYENMLLERSFGVKPNGSWIEDRQWTINVTKILADLGIKYTLIDDSTFFRANPSADELDVFYPHWSIYEGRKIAVFQISEFMRYHFRTSPDDVISYLDSLRSKNPNGNMIVVYGDDAEFGLSEETFVKMLEVPWIKFITLSEYLEKFNDVITEANYDTVGAYPEYENWFGENGTWSKWYFSSEAKYIKSIFDKARNHIIDVESLTSKFPMQVKNITEDAWTALLLAEWQFGPFYKRSEPSNLRWAYDTIAICNMFKLWAKNQNNLPLAVRIDLKENGIPYAVIITKNLGIAVNTQTRVLEYLMDFRIGREIAGLEYLEDWWVHATSGLVIPKLYVSNREISSFSQTFSSNNTQIIFSSTDNIFDLIYSINNDASKISVILRSKSDIEIKYNIEGRVSPGGYYYLMNYGNFSHVHAPQRETQPYTAYDDRVPYTIKVSSSAPISCFETSMWSYKYSSEDTIELKSNKEREIFFAEFLTSLQINNGALEPTESPKPPAPNFVTFSAVIIGILGLILSIIMGIKMKKYE